MKQEIGCFFVNDDNLCGSRGDYQRKKRKANLKR